MTRLRPAPAWVTVAAVLALLVSGCGQASTDDHPKHHGDGIDAKAAKQSWLLAFDDHQGEDGEERQRTFVTIEPATGQATVTTLPTLQKSELRTWGQTLLADAGHRWALLDSQPTASDRRAGRVTLYDLRTAHTTRSFDVRGPSGQSSLTTDWASFDPTEPGLLRVVSGTRVWKVDVDDGTVQPAGSLPRHEGWQYLGGFSGATGEPFVEDLISFKTDPAGNGDDVAHVVRRAGGRVLDASLGADAYGKGTPSPGCESSAGFVAKNGTRWAFCQAGRTIRTRTLAAGAQTWRTLSTSKAVVPSQADPAFALPPSS